MLASSATRPPTKLEELLPPALAAALERLDLVSRRTFAGRMQGERRSKSRGRSVEFEDYRPYVAGDDLRHIDWNVFARLDRFFIKIFQEEQDLSVHIVLDASGSMDAGNPNKLLFAQRLAMALGYLALIGNNRVAAWVIGDERTPTKHLRPMRGRQSVPRLAGFLLNETFARADPVAGAAEAPVRGGFTSGLRTLAASRVGRGVVVVISDLMIADGFEQGLGSLAGGGTGAGGAAGAGGWETTLIQVLAPGEIDPLAETDGSGQSTVIGDLRLTDVETGRVAEVTVTPTLVKRYLERFAVYQERLAMFAAARGMGHVVARSDEDVPALLLGDLRRRGLLK